MRRATLSFCFGLVFLGLATTPTAGQQGGRVRAHVQLVIVGDFPAAWVQPIASSLEAQLNVQIIGSTETVALPRSAYYEPRNRYRAELLTDFLGERIRTRPASVRVLGLTSRDISTTRHPFHDWGILGLADPDARAAIVSSFRMRRRARDPEHAEWRMTTTAVHEVGHLLGLDHCTEQRCLMRDAEGTMDTVDAGDGALGPLCLARVDRFAPVSLERFP